MSESQIAKKDYMKDEMILERINNIGESPINQKYNVIKSIACKNVRKREHQSSKAKYVIDTDREK